MVGIVLSGGENKRFPSLKGFIEIEGSTIIERNIELMRPLVDEVLISANEPEHYFRFGVPIVGDTLLSGGPMAGICSAIEYTGAEAALVVACDMPYIMSGLLRYIIDCAGSGDATVPVFEGKPEPLLAVYGSAAAKTMRARLEAGKRSLMGLLEEINVNWINEDDVRKIDPRGRSFININTLEDLRAVEELKA